MKIDNNVLIEVNDTDIIDGVFENHEVTEVASFCFYELQNLKKVILPKVVKVRNNSFRFNKYLTSIDLPLLKTVWNNCFTFNDSLTSIDLPLLQTSGSFCFRGNDSLINLNLPLLQSAGEFCFSDNDSLINLNLPLLETTGYYCFRKNKSLTTIIISGQKLNYLSVDGFSFIILSEKKVNDYTVYSGYNFNSIENLIISKDECFVAGKDNYFVHGKTIKKVISDLEFKILSEKLENEPIQKDTMFTVNYYRALTGACDLGVRSWMKDNNIPFEVIDEGTDYETTKELTPMKAIDLMPMLEQTKPYGYNKLKSLVTW